MPLKSTLRTFVSAALKLPLITSVVSLVMKSVVEAPAVSVVMLVTCRSVGFVPVVGAWVSMVMFCAACA